MSNRYLKHL